MTTPRGAGDGPPGARAHGGEGGDRDACAVCGASTPARPGGSQLVGGRLVEREIGSCTRCGLQLVRFVGEPWREIRG